jgi:hypothetical protein
MVEAARIPWRPLGRLLVEQGLLSEDELEHALEEQVTTGRRLGETLIDLGFVSHAALSRALTEQYGIEPKAETGFGTGLRAEIERRYERDREEATSGPPEHGGSPMLKLVPEPERERGTEAADPQAIDEEDGYLAQLEEQWARLAAAEAELDEAKLELAALRRRAGQRRDQALRFVQRIRARDRLIVELRAPARGETDLSAPRATGVDAHLVYAPVDGRYVLVERAGEPPQPGAMFELAEIGDAAMIACRIGRSPLPHDLRPCVYAERPPVSSALPAE